MKRGPVDHSTGPSYGSWLSSGSQTCFIPTYYVPTTPHFLATLSPIHYNMGNIYCIQDKKYHINIKIKALQFSLSQKVKTFSRKVSTLFWPDTLKERLRISNNRWWWLMTWMMMFWGWLMVTMMIIAGVCVSSARANEPNKATVQIGAIWEQTGYTGHIYTWTQIYSNIYTHIYTNTYIHMYTNIYK